MAGDTDEAYALSAQRVFGVTVVDDDGTTAFRIDDGEGPGVHLDHSIGDPDLAARRLTDLAGALLVHAERIRSKQLHGPLNGPG